MTNQQLLEIIAAQSEKIINLELDIQKTEYERDLWFKERNEKENQICELKNEIKQLEIRVVGGTAGKESTQ